ncbi:MAG: hypothetical protein NZ483_10665 [Verrucomicrobiae bacterium]|nr:hypothetical protein [Verrucomicrobiae bacterium]MDW8345148.1 DNA-directed RNA polymerase subunit alpha C-terminal domain-containing protein [Verrucomicrobiae bacterium]
MESETNPKSTALVIDNWPVEKAGFNVRVVHCLTAAGVKTVGDLRSWSDDQLLRLRNFGAASLQNVRWFFRLSRHVEARTAPFPHIKAIFHEFLNRQEIYVLEQRYALKDPLFRLGMRRKTLQEIADLMGGVTRERVRQIEEEGLETLRSHLCRRLTEPVELHWVQQIQARGGVVTSAELADWVGDPKLGGYQPWGVLMLMSQVTEAFHVHFDYVSTLTPKALGMIEERVFAVLREAKDLVHFDRIKEAVAPLVSDPNGQLVRVLTVVLNHHPDLCATTDGRYFLPEHGTPIILRDLMRAAGQPVHYRDLAADYNDRMLPASQRRPGYILRVLGGMPDVQRIGRALYELKPSTA